MSSGAKVCRYFMTGEIKKNDCLSIAREGGPDFSEELFVVPETVCHSLDELINEQMEPTGSTLYFIVETIK